MSNSTNVWKGIVAGFIATHVLSMIIMMQQAMGVMPQLNPIEIITHMVGGSTPLAGC
jgi:hypothetical protein